MSKLKLVFNLGFVKEAISSFIPTSLAYIDIFKKIFTRNEAIAFSILTFLILFIILIFIKIKEYQRSVSKALANGYFGNFVEKLVSLFVSKGENPIKFFFASEEKEFIPSKISIQIFLKDTQSKLKIKNAEIRQTANIAYVDKNAYNYPFFVWAKIQDDKLEIYDLPRTLFSLKDFVESDNETDIELDKETRPFYKRFNSEFKKLWTKLDKGGLDINLK